MHYDIALSEGISFYLILFLRIFIAAVCGAAIGWERKRHLKAAGARTHILICCGAALFMILSKYAFLDLSASGGWLFGTTGTDPARIAAQVVTGIGFLGAGAIFKTGNSVKGLTTAAGIWMTAGVGMSVGSGMIILGVFSCAVMLLVQFVIRRQSLRSKSHQMFITMIVNSNSVSAICDELFKQVNGELASHKMIRKEDGSFEHVLTIIARDQVVKEELESFFAEHTEIVSLSIG